MITKEKIVYYIKKYRDNDITVNEIRQEFLDTFVSKAYVFSDHLFVIYDAINGINTEITTEILSDPNVFGYISIWWKKLDRIQTNISLYKTALILRINAA